ncbi:DUF1707 domain-containing protein [Leifsonia sp. RAF41]|uniref:DUF1707 SHOCT-like domain-containing protein n=1 Tax=Leifsonia sp. RAF41 TaxID=3233056 RepID=UPI003F9B8CAC
MQATTAKQAVGDADVPSTTDAPSWHTDGMADIADPSGASLRLSNDERERAVAALQSHAGEGRLTDDELQTRIIAARSAVTRGDLTPLFADLPGGLRLDPSHFGGHPAQSGPAQQAPGQPAPGPQYPQQSYPQPPYAQQPYDTGTSAGWGGGSREPSSRWGLLIVSVIPFVSLILFFVTGMAWGYQYSWLWFLLIPLVGAIAYGSGPSRRR